MREPTSMKRWAGIVLSSWVWVCAQGCSSAEREADANDPALPSCWHSLDGRGLPPIGHAVGFEVGGEYFAAAEQKTGDGALLRFDGEDWATFPLEEDQGGGAPLAIWGADPQHVFVAGYSQVWSFDGRVARQVLAVEEFAITSLWGFAADDVWVGGYRLHSNCSDCEIPPLVELHHFDGTRWRAVSTGFEGRIDSLWGSAPDDLWAVGSVILHFDGARWEHVMALSGAEAQVSGVAADDVFIALGGQAPMHFDGDQWSAVVSDGLAPRAIHAFPDGSAFAYASSQDRQSFVLAWNGDSFELLDAELPALDTTQHVRLSSYGGDLVLLNGRGWRRSGSSFELWYEPSPAGGLSLRASYGTQPRGLLGLRNDTLVDLVDDRLEPLAMVSLPLSFRALDLGASSADDAWLVGESEEAQAAVAYRWDGEQLSALEVPFEGDVKWRQVEVADSGELWIAGIELVVSDPENFNGSVRVRRFDGAQWHDESPEIDETHGIGLTIAEDQVWLHAWPNVVAVHEGDGWTRHDLPESDRRLESLSAAARDDVYAVIVPPREDDGVLMHFDGDEWSAVEALEDYGVRHVSARGSDDVWVTGYADDHALVLRFDGDDWNELDARHFEDLAHAVALGENRAVFAGDLDTWLYDCEAAR